MTLKEAAQTVLSGTSRPKSVEEILAAIEEKSLFTFKASSPNSVLLACLKRHSVNSHSCTPANLKLFRETSDRQFELI